MRNAPWPDGDHPHDEDVRDFLAGTAREPKAVLVADVDGRLIGFIELLPGPTLRAAHAGCHLPRGLVHRGGAHRGRGIERALVTAAEAWGRAQGCTESASDADPENQPNIAAHLAPGFEDTGLVHCLRTPLA